MAFNIQLGKGEAVAYQSKVHLIYCVLGLCLTFLGLNLVLKSEAFSATTFGFYLANLILALGLVVIVRSFINRQTTKMILTNQRILISRGLFKKRSDKLSFEDILQVRVKQNPLQKILNFGLIEILTDNKTYQFRCIEEPQLFIRRFKEISDLTAQIEYFSRNQSNFKTQSNR